MSQILASSRNNERNKEKPVSTTANWSEGDMIGMCNTEKSIVKDPQEVVLRNGKMVVFLGNTPAWGL